MAKVDHYHYETFGGPLPDEGKRQVRAYARIGIEADYIIEEDQKRRRTGQHVKKTDLVKGDKGSSNFINFLQRQIRHSNLKDAVRRNDRVQLDRNGEVRFG